MTEDELKAIDKRLADMSQRVDAVIEKESRGKRMPVLAFKPRAMPAIASNSQQSRPKARYVPPDPDALREEYIERAAQGHEWWENEKTSFEQMWTDFERQFDEMAQAHRYR